MTSIGRHSKFLVFVIVSAMLLMQSIVESHDQFHHHAGDDCVICKIAEVPFDKANLAQEPAEVLPRLIGVYIRAGSRLFENNLWRSALSRAPPTSKS